MQLAPPCRRCSRRPALGEASRADARTRERTIREEEAPLARSPIATFARFFRQVSRFSSPLLAPFLPFGHLFWNIELETRVPSALLSSATLSQSSCALDDESCRFYLLRAFSRLLVGSRRSLLSFRLLGNRVIVTTLLEEGLNGHSVDELDVDCWT